MKYCVFIVSSFLALVIIFRVVTLNISYSHLTSYGYGFLAGNLLLLVAFLTSMFFSGKKIARQMFNKEVEQ